MKFRQKALIALILVTVIGLTFLSTFIHILTESWWFNAVGEAEVYWTRLTWQIILWVGSFVLYALFLWGNYRLALNLTRDRSFAFLRGTTLDPYSNSLSNLGASVLIFIVAFGAAGTSTAAWETVLKYFNSTDFNQTEPIYGRDIGFYLFKLPLYEGVHSWLLTLLILALILSTAVYVLKEQINYRFLTVIPRKVKAHLSSLLAAIALLAAVDFWLERYDLLYSTDGVIFGAGYTDTHARLLAYWVMLGLALLLGVSFVLAIWQTSLAFPIYGVVLYLVALVLVNGVYPGFQQKFVVEPNELEKERPYIENSIQFTRNAYSLEVNSQDFPAAAQLSQQDLQKNQSTVRNIRLWDYRPLLSTYRQLQEIRLYYRFNDVDVDRYTLDGNYRQVMLAPRELSYERVPQRARTWVNQRLKYTHGYGLVMSPVNVVTEEGLPQLFIQDIPPESTVNLEIAEPAIYYGEETNTYIFTGTSTKEFDYPLGDENAFTNYSGSGGVPIPSFWHRLAYAYDLGSFKILISNYFINTSRIHYYRQVQERVRHVAPFLRFDKDPYVSVINGKLFWIIDAYTMSDRYPYSEPVSRSNDTEKITALAGDEMNYIRNSVKVVVDAYNGTMQFFVVDDADPVLATYRKIFPNLFEPTESIPPAVKAHFRYPLDLFKIQAQMFLSYHMSDPQVFYNREDLWRFPMEVYEGNKQQIEPYYLIMRLPEESQEEFILILPFTPVNKDNMIAWMAARSDGENYGKLLLYEFPKQELVYGPSQVEARIDQNPEISEQLTLWSQQGSRVIRGNLLVIPIKESLLYVEPVYLRAEQGELPELKRVIVSYNKDVVMRQTLEQSLAAVFGEESQAPSTSAPQTKDANLNQKSAGGGSGSRVELAQSALDVHQKAQQALRQGNWADYGRYQQQLESLLNQLNEAQ